MKSLTFSDADLIYLRRAIRLAMNGRGLVEPNPMVGCVIVKDDRVIGEGIHAKWGGAHAEPSALASCAESPAGATAYVTLEPCCHLNKKTPPCAPRLIAAGIARVVFGCVDPNPDVNGKGIAMLRDAGIQVDGPAGGVEAEAKQLIAPFLARVNFNRPYVTLKWAESANGKVAGESGRRVKITNEVSDRVVHELRSRCDAIAAGSNTLLSDDPLLTARGVEHKRKLTRVVLSNRLNVNLNSNLVKTAKESPVLVFCARDAAADKAELVEDLMKAGVEIVGLPQGTEGRFQMADVFSELARREVTHLLVEPGPTLARSMIDRGQADRIWVFKSPKAIDANDGSSAAGFDYVKTGSVELAGDRLVEYLNPSSSVYFSDCESADFKLVMAGLV